MADEEGGTVLPENEIEAEIQSRDGFPRRFCVNLSLTTDYIFTPPCLN